MPQVRYDVDKSGTIDEDELREAMRKLGLRIGGLDSATIFRRYDEDGNGSLDILEFAVLVRDLQLFVNFDTDCNGTLDAEELTKAFPQLGLHTLGPNHALTDVPAVLEAWDEDGNGTIDLGKSRASLRAQPPHLQPNTQRTSAALQAHCPTHSALRALADRCTVRDRATRVVCATVCTGEFAQMVADLRAFKQGDERHAGSLGRHQLWTALSSLGLDIQSDASQAYLAELPEEIPLLRFAGVVRTLKEMGTGQGAERTPREGTSRS